MAGDMNMRQDLWMLLPEIVVVLTALAALIAGMLRRQALALPATLVGLSIATLLAVQRITEDMTVFMATFRIDDLTGWAKLILLPATMLSALLVRVEVRGTDREATVYSLLVFGTFGALALAGAGDIMFLVLGVLVTSLASFALVAYPGSTAATEAAMKYFVFGSVSGAVMIFGLTYWYGATGSTLLGEAGGFAGKWPIATAALVAIYVGLGYKAGLVPFHFWAPDAYDGGPLAVAAWLSIVPKVGAVFAIARVVQDMPVDTVNWQLGLATIAVISMTYGNLTALAQTNVVRLLAYSSIAQSGYFLLGLVAIGESDIAVRSLIVFSAAYAAMNIGMFAAIAAVGRELDDFQGIGRTKPWLGVAAVVFLLSLVGIPPLAGFVGKLLLFGAAIDADYTWLAVIGIVNSVLSLAVYLRVIVPMYQPGTGEQRFTIASSTAMVVAVTLIFTVAVGIGAEALL